MMATSQGPRVYIHEFVDVVGIHRSAYQHHMTANWVPEAARYRRQRCFGVFTLVGSTGRWPQVVNMWEFDSWADLAHDFSIELAGTAHRDPVLEEWWAEAAEFRHGGIDRILVAHESSPGVQFWQSRGGTSAVAYVHEILRTRPGMAPAVADQLARDCIPHDGTPPDDMSLVGLFRTAMRNDDEVVLIRSVPDWDTWAVFEAAQSDPTAARSDRDRFELLSLERVLLVDAEFSPLRLGRQPRESDRRARSEVR